MNAAASAQPQPLTALPKNFRAPARAQMRRWSAIHRVKFTGMVGFRCSYYSDTPRLLVFAAVVDDVDATGFMLFEIYIGATASTGPDRLPFAQFEALWNASNPPMRLA